MNLHPDVAVGSRRGQSAAQVFLAMEGRTKVLSTERMKVKVLHRGHRSDAALNMILTRFVRMMSTAGRQLKMIATSSSMMNTCWTGDKGFDLMPDCNVAF